VEKISACVLAYNDEERIEELITSLKGIDDIVVSLDDNSTDKTGKIAKKLGTRVVKRSDFWDNPNQKDVDKFKTRFGFEPRFTPKDKYCHWSEVRNEAMSYCKNDWVFFPDSDEFVEWDLPEVEKLLMNYDQIEYKFVNSPDSSFTHCKLFRKSRNKWTGDVHEVVVPIMNNIMKVYTDKMTLHHHQAIRPYRSNFLPRMEFHLIRNKDIRTIFYLAREYYYNKRYDDSIKMFDEYLKYAWWQPEIVETHYFKALCYWKSNRGNQARQECFEAIHLNPDFKRALDLISEMHYEPWKSKWKRIADNSTNQDVLFG
jgi:glycosyltransferase involved in cell wall biosynthesis